jgi:hypothetical protein
MLGMDSSESTTYGSERDLPLTKPFKGHNPGYEAAGTLENVGLFVYSEGKALSPEERKPRLGGTVDLGRVSKRHAGISSLIALSARSAEIPERLDLHQ